MTSSVRNRLEEHSATNYPHGVSCPGCLLDKTCNQCGAKRITAATGRCTNGRCRSCCQKACRHEVPR